LANRGGRDTTALFTKSQEGERNVSRIVRKRSGEEKPQVPQGEKGTRRGWEIKSAGGQELQKNEYNPKKESPTDFQEREIVVFAKGGV